MSRCDHGYKPVDGYVCAACHHEEVGRLTREIEAINESIPAPNRACVREGGALEDPAASLALSVRNLLRYVQDADTPSTKDAKLIAHEHLRGAIANSNFEAMASFGAALTALSLSEIAWHLCKEDES
jgi:hypothetical protein